ncbi:CoA pyrophosphatase [Romboutsia ilealis]|uniref:CoA pyrophosphatase n=1 Tax=Romboutsia faecis TaxID=2764597 RepID=A0ABR7JPV4_9FIRM|nr:CoA pyrophosphatase [Romboutsia faecis]MBC5996636.1 CoA pyrophosphatase [Romboutsia faecis]MRN24162.1 CoA pyrophosphatase [Romboutsia ilealis]
MLKSIRNKFENYKPYINGFENMKRYSILVPIVKIEDSYYILFEVRSKNLRTQPSEISFPGGRIENGESPLDAAIRETCEELGTNKYNIEIISQLDLLITHMNLIIHPYVGILNNIDNLDINKDEVDHTFLVPIIHLIENKPTYYKNKLEVVPDDKFPYDIIPNKEDYKFQESSYPVLFYEYEDYVIWGLTARILENFLKVLTE